MGTHRARIVIVLPAAALISTLVATSGVLAAGGAGEAPSATPTEATPSPVPTDVVPGSFIVEVREGVNPRTVAARHGVRTEHVYEHAINGFAGLISSAQEQALRFDPDVLRIEPNRIAGVDHGAAPRDETA